MKKITAFLLCFAMLCGMVYYQGQEAPVTALAAEDMVLHVGSPLVLSGNRVEKLDPDNYAVTPVVESGRTLVPLRALAEYFGASVAYDDKTRTVDVTAAGKSASLTVDAAEITVDGKTHTLDVPARIREGRVMVPLRALAELLLEKTVSYFDRVIVIGENSVSLSPQASTYKTAKEKIGAGFAFSTFTELKNYLNERLKDREEVLYRGYVETATTDGAVANDMDMKEAAPMEAPAAAEDAAEAESGGSGSFSETNVQVAVVDEGDIVKTDGKYLYICSGKTLSIVEAKGGDMTQLCKMEFEDNVDASELYLDGNTLLITGTKRDTVNQRDRWYGWHANVYAGVYDISNKTAPTLVRENTLEGRLVSSRKVGDVVYLVTNLYTNNTAEPTEDILPVYKDSALAAGSARLAVEDVTCIVGEAPDTMTQIMAVDIKHPRTPAVVEGFLGSGYQLYMNQNALYLAGQSWTDNKTYTTLLKVETDGLNLGYAASGKVEGYLLNQFSMDEYNGYFRIATTDGSGNHLLVLDQNLNQVGALRNLAPGERIYSVRYQGDTAYVVTFVETDPLFCIDLKDPANPKVLGELKVPGFSNYLHPVGENLLLGIGYDTQTTYAEDRYGNRTELGVITGGLKLSLFDVKNPADPKEVDVLVLGERGSYADVTNDHKALMTDPANHRYGFGAGLQTEDVYREGALVFTIENGKLNAMDLAAPIDTGDYDDGYLNRLVAIGDTVYYLYLGCVNAYNAADMDPINVLKL